MARWMWLWGGKCFGYRSRNSLFTFRGLHIGSFRGKVIFASDGAYLGEVYHEKRLITKLSHKCLLHDGFSPSAGRGENSRINLPSLPIPKGYEDFPDPESFRPEPLQLIASSLSTSPMLLGANGMPLRSRG
jgi:hypothetical protein